MRRGSLPVRAAVDYAVQIAHGLDTAHENGIIHRDLKPENLFITKDGRVKILDFGLAKLTQPQPDALASTQAILQDTSPGAVMGTVGYMSPEQVRGQVADARSDIFAFGAVLFEMLTGKRAFHGTTYADTASAVLHQEPPISEMTASQPPGLQRIISRCLQKNREQRFHSAADLAFAIEALSDTPSGIQPASAVPSSPPLRWVKWGIAAALVLAAISIGWYRHRFSSTAVPGSPTPPLEVRALTENGKAALAAATPDGRYVAYVRRENGESELRLLQVATERDVQVLPGSPLAITSLHFSPDGNFIYFLRWLDPSNPDALGVFRIATLGGPATPLAADARMYSVTVSPDGKQIAYISETPSESQIVAVDPDGANRRILARRPIGTAFWFVEWSPLPDTLAAVAIGEVDMRLVSIELPTGSIRELSVSGWGAVGQPAWSPDGTAVFAPAIAINATSMQIWAIDAHTGARRTVTSGSTNYVQWSLSATANGDLITSTITPTLAIWVTDPSAQPHRIAALGGEGSESVVWVDGRIVTSNISELVVHDTDGGNPTKLRSYSQIYRQLARCGPQHVVYWASDDKNQSHIARTDIVSGATSKLTDRPLDDEPSCTADGSTLIFVHCLVGGNHCLLIRKSLDSGQSVTLYDLGPVPGVSVGTPILSPDGTNVLFRNLPRERNVKNPYDWATVVPASGGEPKRFKMPVPAGEVESFTWAPDGKSILYARSEHGVGNIWSAPLDGRPPKKLTAFDSELIFSFGVSPDNRLAISRGIYVRDVVLISNVR